MKFQKSSNLLFINPWIYDFAAYDFWAKPLGFLYLASLLRKNGYNISFIDCLNSDHPELKRQHGISTLSRRKNGKGKFFKTKIEKPEPLKLIPRNYSRYGITPEIFEEELKNTPPPKVILVTSTMTYWYPGVFEVIKVAKSFFPHIPIILGGIYATLCYYHAKKYSGADFVVSGVAELEVLKLISSLTGKKPYFPLRKKISILFLTLPLTF
jgi:radical SAM superfamily enzyme YgiQ (UPF0313 family)